MAGGRCRFLKQDSGVPGPSPDPLPSTGPPPGPPSPLPGLGDAIVLAVALTPFLQAWPPGHYLHINRSGKDSGRPGVEKLVLFSLYELHLNVRLLVSYTMAPSITMSSLLLPYTVF